jgi:hypothetical protein
MSPALKAWAGAHLRSKVRAVLVLCAAKTARRPRAPSRVAAAARRDSTHRTAPQAHTPRRMAFVMSSLTAHQGRREPSLDPDCALRLGGIDTTVRRAVQAELACCVATRSEEAVGVGGARTCCAGCLATVILLQACRNQKVRVQRGTELRPTMCTARRDPTGKEGTQV